MGKEVILLSLIKASRDIIGCFRTADKAAYLFPEKTNYMQEVPTPQRGALSLQPSRGDVPHAGVAVACWE